MKRILTLMLLAILVSMLLVGCVPAPATLSVSDAWAYPIDIGSAGGVFMTITNGTGEADKLLEARTDKAMMVQLHTMAMVDGSMKMQQVPEIAIPAGGQVVLKPKDLHVMMMNLVTSIEEGEKFPVILRFEKAGEKTVEVTVKANP
jgi:periplasmic copper chaperone A